MKRRAATGARSRQPDAPSGAGCAGDSELVKSATTAQIGMTSERIRVGMLNAPERPYGGFYRGVPSARSRICIGGLRRA